MSNLISTGLLITDIVASCLDKVALEFVVYSIPLMYTSLRWVYYVATAFNVPCTYQVYVVLLLCYSPLFYGDLRTWRRPERVGHSHCYGKKRYYMRALPFHKTLFTDEYTGLGLWNSLHTCVSSMCLEPFLSVPFMSTHQCLLKWNIATSCFADLAP